VPANPNALQQARLKGIDTRPLVEWAERTLDGEGRASLPLGELERLRRAAREQPTMTAPPPRQRAGKPTNPRRSDGAGEADPAAGGAIVGNCGRKAEEPCGMSDPAECSVHAGAEAALDGEEAKRLAGLLARLFPRRKDGGPDDDVPLEHEDAIRVAHKCLRTSKAFLTEAVSQHSKAIDLLGGVVDALDAADPISSTAPPDAGTEVPDGEKAAQLARATALKARLAAP
jgi:hypothetical protein